jgi:hypothetical protein
MVKALRPRNSSRLSPRRHPPKYSATELCAKAELISALDPALMKSKKHETFRPHYNRHAKLGDTEQRFAAC